MKISRNDFDGYEMSRKCHRNVTIKKKSGRGFCGFGKKNEMCVTKMLRNVTKCHENVTEMLRLKKKKIGRKKSVSPKYHKIL